MNTPPGFETPPRRRAGAIRWTVAVVVFGAYLLGVWGLTQPEHDEAPHAQTRSELARAQEERARVEARIADLDRRHAAELDALRARIDALEAKLDEAEADRASIRQDVDDAVRRTRIVSRSRAAPSPAGDRFDALAACESTGDRDGVAPHRIDERAANPTGRYLGAFQFDRATWASVGGTGDPRDVPYARQRDLAVRLHAARGWAPWPTCAKILGYT